MMKCMITNNIKVADAMKDRYEIEYLEGSPIAVFEKARDKAARGAALIMDPKVFKLNSPFRSIPMMVPEEKGAANEHSVSLLSKYLRKLEGKEGMFPQPAMMADKKQSKELEALMKSL